MTISTILPGAEDPSVRQDSDTGHVILTNGRLKLTIGTKPGLNAHSLRDLKTGRVYADQDYVWDWPGAEFPQLEGTPVIENKSDGSKSVAFKGRLGAIIVQQSFTASKNDPDTILESIEICNISDNTIATNGFKCGFAKSIRDGETWSPDADNTVCSLMRTVNCAIKH